MTLPTTDDDQRPHHRAATLPLDRESVTAALLSLTWVTAGGLVATVNSAAPFEHGSWLAAYLVLVCGVAQLALSLGPLLLSAAPATGRLRRLQTGLWNVGSLPVAAGVLIDSLALVLVASAVLVAALACFAAGARARRPIGPGLLAYQALLAMLGVSIVVGGVLAA